MTQMYGKYRGVVTGHEPAPEIGRLKVAVPSVLGEGSVWAMPCVPYAGDRVGWFLMPPVGSGVWVEFEGGDLSLPIWTGCFWRGGELPTEATSSSILVLKTDAPLSIVDGTITTEC